MINKVIFTGLPGDGKSTPFSFIEFARNNYNHTFSLFQSGTDNSPSEENARSEVDCQNDHQHHTNTIIAQASLSQEPNGSPNSRDPLREKTRMILACISGLLALLSFVAFVITRNDQALFGTSVLAYPFFRVIDYYFGRTETPSK